MSDDPGSAVVLHYRGGTTVHCSLVRGFSPSDAVIEVTSKDGTAMAANLGDLKAVFFLKDPRQRQVEMQIDEPAPPTQGGAVARVEFFDGEIIRGRVLDYSVANQGFYLYPTSLESNNERVFVVASALTTVALEES